MAIEIRISGVSKFGETARKLYKARQALKKRIYDIANLWGFDTRRHMREDYMTGPRPSKIAVVHGKLKQEMRFQAIETPEGVSVIFGNPLPYARIHEEGGDTHPKVTEKMRAWAWWRYKETGDQKYKGIALTKKGSFQVHIPARPYMHPAVRDTKPELRANIDKALAQAASEGIRQK